MEEKKYYTPSIEEFHVGFEYEIDSLYFKMISRVAWKKELYELTGSWKNNKEDLDLLIRDRAIRVKYLDKEDIESLGWRHDQYHVYSKEIDKQSYILLFHQLDKLEIRPNGNNPFLPTFCGCIKNKSELKVLMKQLGIQ